MAKNSTIVLVAIIGGLGLAPAASAQPLGSYRWQLEPYCNILTLAVVQQGGQYQLDGTDDQCGAAQAASVRGMAFQNLNGTIGFGLTIVTAPGGTPVHVDATLTFPGLNGTWRDSAGHTGNLIFGAGVPAVGPRPVLTGGLPPGSVTTIQIAPGAVTSTQLALNAVTGANIVNGSVTMADLATPPALAGTVSAIEFVNLTGAQLVVRTVSLTIPSNGTVIANATGLFELSSAVTNDGGWCSITTGTTVDNGSLLVVEEGTPDALTYAPFGGTRFFNVTPGTFTVRLVCTLFGGSAGLYSPALNALFIPG